MNHSKAGIAGIVLILAAVVCDPNNWNLVSTGFAQSMFIIGFGLLIFEMWQSGVASGSEY